MLPFEICHETGILYFFEFSSVICPSWAFFAASSFALIEGSAY